VFQQAKTVHALDRAATLIGRSGGIDPHFLDLGIVGGEWSASCPGRFILQERGLGNHYIGGWVGPRAGLNTVEERRISSLPQIQLALDCTSLSLLIN
jgi:hypothetical protein